MVIILRSIRKWPTEKLHRVLSWKITCLCMSLHWRHNDHDGVSNHQPHDCLFNRLFRCRSKKTSKLRVTGLCVGKSPGPVNSPHKGPVTRKMFPFDDVIMDIWRMWLQSQTWKMAMHVLTKYYDVEDGHLLKPICENVLVMILYLMNICFLKKLMVKETDTHFKIFLSYHYDLG